VIFSSSHQIICTFIEYDGIDIAARETSTGIGPDYTDRTSAFYTVS